MAINQTYTHTFSLKTWCRVKEICDSQFLNYDAGLVRMIDWFLTTFVLHLVTTVKIFPYVSPNIFLD
jgi:hypothetical protein